jgi:RNA polymerase sigma-70 factor (ECF subfamily)
MAGDIDGHMRAVGKGIAEQRAAAGHPSTPGGACNPGTGAAAGDWEKPAPGAGSLEGPAARAGAGAMGGGPGVPRLLPAAFAARFEASSHVLWCIAAGVLGDRHEAEDVVQEAALVALQKLAQFDPGTSFVAWMGQIVHFIALNRSRRRARSGTFQTDPQVMETIDGSPAGVATSPVDSRGELLLDQPEFDDQVLAGLARLDPTARACLLLRTVLDMPYREIAPALDIPEGTAMSHVHRARKALREFLLTSGRGRDAASRDRPGAESS